MSALEGTLEYESGHMAFSPSFLIMNYVTLNKSLNLSETQFS